LIAEHFPGAQIVEAVPLTLRDSFVAFARRFRLEQSLPAAAA
jgi:hypothetical protein